MRDLTKAHSCREEVAKFVTHPKSSMIINIEVITDAPALDPVAL